ncbi:MAG: TIGR03790 family protein [Verrucomicrobiaceae bacterium]
MATNHHTPYRSNVRLRAQFTTGMILLVSILAGLSQAICAPTKPAVPVPTPAREWEPVKETVVVYNPACEGSEALAKYYAGLRHIPDERIVGIECPKEETITRDEFEKTIREPLLKKFTENKWWVLETRDVLDPNGRPSGKEPQVVSQDVRVLVLMRRVVWPMPPRFGGAIAIGDPREIRRNREWPVRVLAAWQGGLPVDNFEGLAIEPQAGRNAVERNRIEAAEPIRDERPQAKP